MAGKHGFSAADRAELARVIRELYGIRESDDRSQNQKGCATGAEDTNPDRISRTTGICEMDTLATAPETLLGETE